MPKTDSTRQQRRYGRLIQAGLKHIHVWIDKDDKKAEEAVRSYDKRHELSKRLTEGE